VDVALRQVADEDLAIFFEHEQDAAKRSTKSF
jgi:hypothetical protein